MNNIGNIYIADEGKLFVRIIDDFIMGNEVDLGPTDSIVNYTEHSFTQQEISDFYETVGIEIYHPENADYLTFTSQQNGSKIQLNKTGSPHVGQLQYSVDSGSSWNEYTWKSSTGLQLTLDKGNQVMFRGKGIYSTGSSNYYKFVMSGKFAGSGSVDSLINITGQDAVLQNYCYFDLFYGCQSLTTAPTLPTTTLADYCYEYMFFNCTGLTTTPALPATTLASYCYASMFQACTGLTTAPTLPATSLASGCYSYMFYNCTGLTTAPTLPATTLASNCYYYMFSGCAGLTTAPTLPATTLANNCYSDMFYGCTGLTITPALPATTLTESCYSHMFYNCTGLTTASSLPATTLANNCYNHMFRYCTRLTTAPTLPATTLTESCYNGMFRDCTGLTTPPELPATTLANNCYSTMFYNCTGLTTAPTLPATTLTESCYYSMFYNCTSLTTAPELPATTLASSCYSSMFYGCTGLTTASTLPATTLVLGCYRGMFRDCTGLLDLPVFYGNNSETIDSYFGGSGNYCQSMFSGCSSITDISNIFLHSTHAYYGHLSGGIGSTDFVLQIPETITNISTGAFTGVTNKIKFTKLYSNYGKLVDSISSMTGSSATYKMIFDIDNVPSNLTPESLLGKGYSYKIMKSTTKIYITYYMYTDNESWKNALVSWGNVSSNIVKMNVYHIDGTNW